MEGLGRLYDIGIGAVPVDMNAGDGVTGKRIALSGARAVDVVVFLGAAASGSDNVTVTVQEHTAYTSGTSRDLDVVEHYYIKSEAALDNDEAWTRVAQTAGDITLAGASLADKQCVVVFTVDAAQLSDDASHISVNVAYPTNAVRTGAVLYFPTDLRYQRKPAKLQNLLRPGAANA